MTEARTLTTSQAIQRIVAQVVERFHPEKVILFGSHANGTPTDDSDVDLLVLMEADGSPLHAAARISASVDHPLPLDILVMEPERFRDAVERGAIFATEVAARGVVLYEA